MPVTTDIAASYRRPGAVVRGHLARGVTEPRALAFLMGGCLVVFVGQWPRLAREAHLTEGQSLEQLLAGAFFGWVLVMPLVLYALAGLAQLLARAIRRPVGGLASRFALFWAFLAASPLALLAGLTGGFVGEGIEAQIVGAAWLAAFLWFWITGLRTIRAEAA
jgi:hypothetical protein